jgi:hypothetical protein
MKSRLPIRFLIFSQNEPHRSSWRAQPVSSIEANSPSADSFTIERSAGHTLPGVGVWALALMAGLIAGFSSWLIGEKYHGRFDPVVVKSKSPRSSRAEINARFIAKQAGDISETTLAFAAMGSVFGFTLGLAGGVARRSARAALIAALVGLVLGGVAAGAITWVIQPFYYKYLDSDTNDLLMAVLFHVVVCCSIGALGGLAFSIGLGDRKRCGSIILGGLIGAMAGVLVYEVVGSIACPGDGITSPLSNSPSTRLCARLAVTTFAAAGAALGAFDRRTKLIPNSVTAATQP